MAKANLARRGSRLLGGVLDSSLRNGQDGQTKGLPIGPDTSLLLAEIILCAIDEQLQRRHPQTYDFCTRFVDDLEFSAQSQGEAEDVLSAWDSLLNSYDLSLNPTKTDITAGPIPPEFPWRVQLSQFELRYSTDTVLTNDLRSFFSLAFELAKQNPIDSVLSYAISRVNPRPTGVKSWQAFSDLLLGAVVAEPSSLRFAYRVFTWADRNGISIDKTSVADSLNSMCSHHAPLEHGSEVAWSLAIMRMLDLPLSSDAAAHVASMQDNCSLLLLLDSIARKRVSGPGPNMTGVISRAEDPIAWKSEDWLLGYECGRMGWANDANFQMQSHWAELRRLGVSFFLINPPSPPSTGLSSAPTSDDEDEGYEDEGDNQADEDQDDEDDADQDDEDDADQDDEDDADEDEDDEDEGYE